jgi:hypothetical protein
MIVFSVENYHHFSMNDKVVLLSTCQTISLLKTDFHRINQILYAVDKTFEVKVCSKSYFFSKEQIILFSITAFLTILETHHAFHVLCPHDISEELIISCFRDIFSLFSKSEEFLISQNNAFIFRYLSEVFENLVLFSICQDVLMHGHPQLFFLNSELFAQIPRNLFDSLNDFRILLNNEEIKYNHVFASLISNRILSQIKEHPNLDFIDFSHYQFPEFINIFFGILKRNRIEINESNFEQIYDAIHFLEFSSDSIKSFFQNSSLSFISNDISQISSVPIYSIESIISSYFLRLRTENQLFEFVQQQIQENREYLSFFRYVYFGLVDNFNLINLINSIQFGEIDHCLFEHLQNTFFSNSLLSFKNEIEFKDNQILLSSEKIDEYFEEEKKNREIKFFYEFYPILFPNVLEIEANGQIQLSFTEDQIGLIKQFQCIEVISGKVDNFVAKIYSYRRKIIFLYSFQFLLHHWVMNAFKVVPLFLKLLFPI